MKKALRIGAAAVALATVATVGAIFNTGHTSENDFAAAPFIQTAVLKQGASGGEVKEVQRRLKQWGYYSGTVDGIYGKATVEAVKKFQRKNGLTVDGIAGRLNRVASSQFPNTISGVIYQKGAFTAVSDGQINLSPNKTAMNAAQDAMNGWDPTYGCLYYYNPAVATSSWIFGRKTVTTIGKHIFAI